VISLEVALSHAGGGSIDIGGTREALNAFATLLGTREPVVVAVPSPPKPPDPYDCWITSIAIHPETEPQLLITASATSLTIRGGRKSLELLGENIEYFANREDDGRHTHIEYYPGHFYLREGSMPLIVSIA
jgi:hypothetical protein